MHNSKEILNVNGLFVWKVGYVDMTTNPLTNITILLKEYTLLFILFISTFSVVLFLYTYHGGKREISSMPG